MRGQCQSGRAMIAAVRAELGPTLGLAVMREPTAEECAQIERQWSLTLDSVAETQEVRPDTCGRAMFDAVRAVMWPKGGES